MAEQEANIADGGAWLVEMRALHAAQLRDIELRTKEEHLSEEALRKLDSTLKKLTAFMKKVKGLGATTSAASLMTELEKLNVSKFLEVESKLLEIATNVCGAKVKIADVPQLVALCVRLARNYEAFPEILLAELRKQLPMKRSDVVENASKLRVDLKFLADLCLHGVLGAQGLKTLGSTLSYLTTTDKAEHANVGVLMPFCRYDFLFITGRLPLSQQQKDSPQDPANATTLLSPAFTQEQRSALTALLDDYFNSLAEHLRTVKAEMRSLHKSITRHERTRGDAPPEDRERFEQLKVLHERLSQNVADLSENLGIAVPPMPEAPPSEDEDEEAARAGKSAEGAAGKPESVWPDEDARDFYERLIDVRRLVPRLASMEMSSSERGGSSVVGEGDEAGNDNHLADGEEQTTINADIDQVDMEELLNEEQQAAVEDEEEKPGEAADEAPEETRDEQATEGGTPPPPDNDSMDLLRSVLFTAGRPSADMREFLQRMVASMNKELIDQLAVEFLTHHDTKANKKRLMALLLEPPKNRLDLLPFYGRFLATIRRALPELTKQVELGLLTKFRELVKRGGGGENEAKKKGKEKKSPKADENVHLCRYLAELTKFGILPKAEALTCLRSLLVDLKSYRVEMISAMVESMGAYLLKSASSHSKMEIIMQVLQKKAGRMKDPRHVILLDNAYFAVYPPEEKQAEIHPLQPLREYLQKKLTSEPLRKCLSKFRKLDWEDREVAELALRLLCDPSKVRYDQLEKLAELVSVLSKYHERIGVRVVDEIVEFVRLSMEVSHLSLQQRVLSSVIYLGQLYNYSVCNSTTVFKVLYQLISFGLPPVFPTQREQPPHQPMQWPVGAVLTGMQRTRLALGLAHTVGEFFVKGGAKKRMDCFLYHLLLFHYEVVTRWTTDYKEQVGDYPSDMSEAAEELLETWRRDGRKHFPKTAEQARDCITRVEKQYRVKAEEMVGRSTHTPRHQSAAIEQDEEEDARRKTRLDQIEEEGDEDATTGEHDRVEHEASQSSSQLSQLNQPAGVYGEEEEEKVVVHKQERTAEEIEDDEVFARDFERLMLDTMKSAPLTHKGPPADLSVPPMLRQKFEKKISFAPDTHGRPEHDVLGVGNGAEKKVKIALMTRGKDRRPELKAVDLPTSESMLETWRQYNLEKEDERLRLKAATLAMSGYGREHKASK